MCLGALTSKYRNAPSSASRRSGVTDLGQLAQLAEALAALDDETLDRLHTAHARAGRLAGREEGAAPETNPDLLVEPAEVDLARAVAKSGPEIQAALQRGDSKGALAAASELGEPVDRFFEDVLVMADDRAVRANYDAYSPPKEDAQAAPHHHGRRR